MQCQLKVKCLKTGGVRTGISDIKATAIRAIRVIRAKSDKDNDNRDGE